MDKVHKSKSQKPTVTVTASTGVYPNGFMAIFRYRLKLSGEEDYITVNGKPWYSSLVFV